MVIKPGFVHLQHQQIQIGSDTIDMKTNKLTKLLKKIK